MAEISLSWDAVEARKAWSAELLNAVRAHKAELDLGNPEAFIPGYNQLTADQQLKFWGELIVAMAKFESGWKPNVIFHEPAPLNIDSVGLLQLSYEDQPNYKLEPLDRAKKSLEDPLVNLRCAVKIMARLVAKDRVVASGAKKQSRGAARYWSVLREGHKVDQIKALTRTHLGL
ncbi:MAG TPA: transglycosylase SLT domain-containing protein [Longimicrobium sp.]